MKQREPILNIPEKSVVALIVPLLVIHFLASMPAIRTILYEYFLLVPMEITAADVTPFRQIISLLGHGFLHGSLGHVLMNSAMILIFGIITVRSIRALKPAGADLRFWLIFLLGVIGGGIAQWGVWAATNTDVAAALGASGGASALFATAGWAIGGRDRLIGYGLGWVLLNIGMVLAEPLIGPISWAAHIGGFVIGAWLAPYWVKPSSASGTSILR